MKPERLTPIEAHLRLTQQRIEGAIADGLVELVDPLEMDKPFWDRAVRLTAKGRQLLREAQDESL